MRKKEEKNRRTMRDRIREKANKPRVSKYDYIILPDGFEKFQIEGKTKTVGDKKTITKRIDIMPYIAGQHNPNCDKGEMYYERTFFVHKLDLGDNNITFICPNKSAGKPCPACEYLNKLRKDPRATKEEIGHWTPKERQLFNVRDLNEPDKTKILEMSYHMFGKLLEARISGQDDDDNFDRFADLQGGLTLRVQFEEKKFGAGRYHEAISIDFKDREEDYEDDVIDESACLDDMLIIKEYDELNKLIFESSFDNSKTEVVEENDDDEDDDVTPKKVVRKTSPKKVVEKEEDDEDFEEDDEKPVKKSSKTSSKKVVEKEEDDEDEDDFEDDEEENPDGIAPDDDDFEDDDFEEEEEEEKPVKKSSKKVVEKEYFTDDGDFEDEEEEKPVKKSSKTSSKKSTKKISNRFDKECPYGHKFGYDCDENHCVQDCKDCDLWDDCSDYQDELDNE